MKSKNIILVLALFATTVVGCKPREVISSTSGGETISQTSQGGDQNSQNGNNNNNNSSATSSRPVVDPNKDYYQSGDYYNSVDDSLSGDSLISKLNTVISSGHKSLGYSGVWTAYGTTDVYPGTKQIWDIYTDKNKVKYYYSKDQGSSSPTEGNGGYNREHTIPKSWWGGSTSVPQGNDIYIVLPTDVHVNGVRSNYPYGEVGSASYTSTNGCKLGSSNFPGYSGTVFEVADEYKGDVARIYFYAVTRYNQKTNAFTSSEGNKVFKSSFPYLTDYALKLFLKWSENDPVSQKEIDKNNAAFKLQGNRNPYVDHASYVQKVFGGNGTGTIGGNNGGGGQSQDTTYKVCTSPVVGKPYKWGLTQGGLGKDLFFNGSTNDAGYYLNTTDSYKDGADVYIENAAGGYYMYYMNGSLKTYINMTHSNNGTKDFYNASLGTTPMNVWTFNTEKNTFVTKCDGEDCYIGSYNSFTTLSGSKTSYFTSSTSYQSHFYEAK